MKKSKVLGLIMIIILTTLLSKFLIDIKNDMVVNKALKEIDITKDEYLDLKNEYIGFVNNSVKYIGYGDLYNVGDYTRLSDVERKIVIYSLKNNIDYEEIKEALDKKYLGSLNVSSSHYLGYPGRRMLRNDLKFYSKYNLDVAKKYEAAIINAEYFMDNLGITTDIELIENDDRTLEDIYVDDFMGKHDYNELFIIASLIFSLYILSIIKIKKTNKKEAF